MTANENEGKHEPLRVLLFAAHPDDEVIGVGGALRRLADAGARIRTVLFSAGAEGYTRLEDKERITDIRAQEYAQVCEVLGVQERHSLGLLDWSLAVSNETYRAVIGHIRDFRPDVVFTHSRADYADHRAVHDVVTEGWYHAAIPCALDQGEPWKQVPLYEFEVLQAMPEPSHVLDITDTYAAKVQAMRCYDSQHDVVGGIFQMMEGRALERGYFVGRKYGEAFRRSLYRPQLVTGPREWLE